jgi:hypothetical protein
VCRADESSLYTIIGMFAFMHSSRSSMFNIAYLQTGGPIDARCGGRRVLLMIGVIAPVIGALVAAGAIGGTHSLLASRFSQSFISMVV